MDLVKGPSSEVSASVIPMKDQDIVRNLIGTYFLRLFLAHGRSSPVAPNLFILRTGAGSGVQHLQWPGGLGWGSVVLQ